MHFLLVILNRTSRVIKFMHACTRGVELKKMNMATDNGGNVSQAPTTKRETCLTKAKQFARNAKWNFFNFRNRILQHQQDRMSKIACPPTTDETQENFPTTIQLCTFSH